MVAAKYPQQIDRARTLIEVDMMTQQEAALVLGIDRTTVQRWCYRFGIETQRPGPRNGDKHPDWKGGRKKVGRYWYCYAPEHPFATKQRYVAEHRLVMEATLERYLLRHEVVHHRNGNPEDNRPENLEVFQTNAEHLRHELTGKIPQWTPEGWHRIRTARKKTASPHQSKSDDHPHTQTTGHPA